MVNVLIVDAHILMRRAVREVIEQEDDLTVVAEAGNSFEAEEQAQQYQPDVILMDLDMPGCDGFEATERILTHSPHSRVVIFATSHEERHVFQAIQRGAIGYITKDTDPEALIHSLRCAARNDLCIPGALATQILTYIRTIWRSHPYLSPSRRSTSTSFSYRTPRRLTAHRANMVQASSQNMELATAESTIEVGSETNTATEMTVGSGDPLSTPSLIPLPILTVRPLTDREQEILDLMRKGRKNREIAGELSIAESTVHKHVQNIFEKLHARNRTEAIYFTSTEE